MILFIKKKKKNLGNISIKDMYPMTPSKIIECTLNTYSSYYMSKKYC